MKTLSLPIFVRREIRKNNAMTSKLRTCVYISLDRRHEHSATTRNIENPMSILLSTRCSKHSQVLHNIESDRIVYKLSSRTSQRDLIWILSRLNNDNPHELQLIEWNAIGRFTCRQTTKANSRNLILISHVIISSAAKNVDTKRGT